MVNRRGEGMQIRFKGGNDQSSVAEINIKYGFGRMKSQEAFIEVVGILLADII